MTIADEARAVAATLPDATFDALVTAGALELTSVGADSAQCLSDLANAIRDRGIYEAATTAANNQDDLNVAEIARLDGVIVNVTGQIAAIKKSVTARALTSNVVTLTVASGHGLVSGDQVVVFDIGAPFDGTYTLTGATSTTVTYAKTNANVGSASVTGGVAKTTGTDTTSVNRQILNGRSALTAAKHYLLPKTVDWKGVTNVTAAVLAATPTNGTAAAPATLDYWPGQTYLQEDMLRYTFLKYCTIRGHGATVKVLPARDLGICTVDGRTPITASYSSTAGTPGSAARRTLTGTGFVTGAGWVGTLVQDRLSDNTWADPAAVGIPTGSRVVSTTSTTILIDHDVTLTKTNEPLYINDASPYVVSDGSGDNPAGWTTAELIGRTFLLKSAQATLIPEPGNQIVGVRVGGVLQPYSSSSRSLTFQMAQAARYDASGRGISVSGGTTTNPSNVASWPKVRNRQQFYLARCTDIRLTDMTILGGVPDYWNDSGDPTVPRLENDVEGQHSIEVAGTVAGGIGTGVVIDNITFRNTWANWVHLSRDSAGVTPDGVTIRDCNGNRTARQALAPVDCKNVTIGPNNVFDNMGRSMIDMEATSSQVVDGVTIINNTFGLNTGFPFISSVCDGHVDNIVITGNKLTRRPLSVQVWGRTNLFNNWTFSNNTGAGVDGNGQGASTSWININGFTFTGNVQQMKLSATSTPAPYMYLAIGTSIGAHTVSGNSSGNPPTAKAQALINGVPEPTTVTPRVGIPTSGAYAGGVVNPRPPIVASPSTIITATADMETALGFGLSGHRVYTQPSDGFRVGVRQSMILDDRDNGRISYLSFALPASTTWQDMTNNTALLQAAADDLRTLTDSGCDIVVMADHEPDVVDQSTQVAFSQAAALEYAAFQTAFFTRVRTTAPAVTRAMTFGGYKLYAGTMTQARALAYLPTDKSLIELIGNGPYNSTYSGGPANPTFAQRIATYLTLIAAYGKPGFIHEMGCYTSTTPDKAAWWSAAIAHVKAHPELKAMLFFHSSGGATDVVHDFWIDDTVGEFNAIKSVATGLGQAYFHPVTLTPTGGEQADGAPTTASLLARAGTVTSATLTNPDWSGLHVDSPVANKTYDLRGMVLNGYFAADAVGGFDGRAYGLPDFRSGTMSYAGATQTFPPASGTPFRNTSPYRFGNAIPSGGVTTTCAGFAVVGGRVVGNQPGLLTMPWNVIKHGTPCQVANNSVRNSGSTATNQDGNPEIHTPRGSWSVTSGCRTHNGMDGFGIVGQNSADDTSDTENGKQYFRNCWVSNCHDDSMENDNHYLATWVTDCLFEDVHNWLSCKDNGSGVGPSAVKAWHVKDCVVKLLARPGPSGFEDTYDGHGGFYKMNANAPGIRLNNVVLAAHQPATAGKLDLPQRTVGGTLIDTYSNVKICWTGSGSYPSTVPPGCTLIVNTPGGTQAATIKIANAVADWKTRHGVTDFNTVDMTKMLAPTTPPTY